MNAIYQNLVIEDYNYTLPDERIAKYPLEQRDASKLLLYKNGVSSTYIFKDLPDLLEKDNLLVFNETRVVPARLFFHRLSGAAIEVFCLEPVSPSEYNLSFASSKSCQWRCIVGNVKRWKGDTLYLINTSNDLALSAVNLRADLVVREGRTAIVEFTWDGGLAFSDVLERCGRLPIPPYLGRETEAVDLERYQTTYARIRGSVAAPTAGLHFTPQVLDALAQKGIETAKVCLHVGAGTFLPVKTSLVKEHQMHREPFSVSRELIARLLKGGSVTAVGTTSVRTLESLYYAGVSIIEDGKPQDIAQAAPYERDYPYSTQEALQAIAAYLDANGLGELRIGTRIIIVPGFRWRVVDNLITNFHQPCSTLLLLISAFVGEEHWRDIYTYALDNGYRFLSYGDSSLLMGNKNVKP